MRRAGTVWESRGVERGNHEETHRETGIVYDSGPDEYGMYAFHTAIMSAQKLRSLSSSQEFALAALRNGIAELDPQHSNTFDGNEEILV